jgi:hypothetical protein
LILKERNIYVRNLRFVLFWVWIWSVLKSSDYEREREREREIRERQAGDVAGG